MQNLSQIGEPACPILVRNLRTIALNRWTDDRSIDRSIIESMIDAIIDRDYHFSQLGLSCKQIIL